MEFRVPHERPEPVWRFRRGEGHRHDVPGGLELLQSAAAQGNIHSINFLGELYRLGLWGVPKDSTKSVAWYRKAAELGDAIAEGRLAIAYEVGDGVPQDKSQAALWFAKAAGQIRRDAEAGDVAAQLSLGLSYELGSLGLPMDKRVALVWYRKAAAQEGPLKATAEQDVARVERELRK